MNREIKFRVWDKRFKQFITDKNYEKDEIIFAWTPFGLLSPKDYQNDIIIQQFTGLLDRNGKEIYEGDIVKETTSKGTYKGDYILKDNEKEIIQPIIWNNYSDGEYVDKIECWMFGSRDSMSELIHRTASKAADWIREYEVIGNIYENPDLLK